jgi:hypothetical protein
LLSHRKRSPSEIAVKVDGRIVRKMLLQLVVGSMIREAASGASWMVAYSMRSMTKVIPTQEKLEGGFLFPGSTVAGRVHREKSSSQRQRAKSDIR